MKNKIIIFCAALLLTLILGGCADKTALQSPLDGSSDVTLTEKSEITFTDQFGKTVTVCSPKKIAAFSASLAEIWQLAGGEISFATSDAFDDEKIILPNSAVNIGDMNSPSAELLIDGGADLVLLSSAHGGQRLEETLDQVGIHCAKFDIENFSDYLELLKICTDITGRADLYEKNGLSLERNINSIKEKRQSEEQKTVLYLRAFSSGIKAKNSNSMTGKMLADLNCENIADETSLLLEDLSVEKIIELDPDFIFITIMGSDEEKARDSYEKMLMSNPAWSGLTAARNDRCIFLPTKYFHNKPNAEWDKAYEMLAEILEDI